MNWTVVYAILATLATLGLGMVAGRWRKWPKLRDLIREVGIIIEDDEITQEELTRLWKKLRALAD